MFRVVQAADVLKIICDYYDYSIQDLRNVKRSKTINRAKLVCYYVLCKVYGFTMYEVADLLHRSPDTVRYGYTKVKRNFSKYSTDIILIRENIECL